MSVSGKTGDGIHELLETIVSDIPAPVGDTDAPLKALIFDSYFDPYRGVVALVRIVDGALRGHQRVRLMSSGLVFETEEVGVRRPAETPLSDLGVGEVGYMVTGLKDPLDVRVGDTVTDAAHPADEALPGYREVKPMVYAGLFPIDTEDFENLRDALDKLRLNDPAVVYTPETSVALGFGFRVGFLGLLHMEVVKERLEREFNLDLIATAPSVEYNVYLTNREMLEITSPQDMPEPSRIDRIEEPYLTVKVLVPPDYVGAVMDLTIDHRGTFLNMVYLSPTTVEMHWEMRLCVA